MNGMNLCKFLVALGSVAIGGSYLRASQSVDKETMERIYNEVKTDYKYGLVIAPEDNEHKVDCPTIFRVDSTWYMSYIRLDNDRGYETMLAKSDNLINWETLGTILSFPDSPRWDLNQRGGFPSLIDWEWGGKYSIGEFDGKYWMTYIGGPEKGYETPPLSIGLAYTTDTPQDSHFWECLDHPVMTCNDSESQWWEKLVQYKSCVYAVDPSILGHQFVMFYNSLGQDEAHPRGERIGIALSDDMIHWSRYQGNPVFSHESQRTITGDAQIAKIGNLYVMFYFSAFNPSRPYMAYNTFAASYDLINWTDWTGTDLIIPSETYDEKYAHKSCVVKHDGVVYHFYCAVNSDEQRGIALATSKDLGKSDIKYLELSK